MKLLTFKTKASPESVLAALGPGFGTMPGEGAGEVQVVAHDDDADEKALKRLVESLPDDATVPPPPPTPLRELGDAIAAATGLADVKQAIAAYVDEVDRASVEE